MSDSSGKRTAFLGDMTPERLLDNLRAFLSTPGWEDELSRPGQPDPPLAPDPTDTEPGSHSRLAVYEWRYRNGFAVFHPDDLGQPRRRPRAAPPEDGRLYSPQETTGADASLDDTVLE